MLIGFGAGAFIETSPEYVVRLFNSNVFFTCMSSSVAMEQKINGCDRYAHNYKTPLCFFFSFIETPLPFFLSQRLRPSVLSPLSSLYLSPLVLALSVWLPQYQTHLSDLTAQADILTYTCTNTYMHNTDMHTHAHPFSCLHSFVCVVAYPLSFFLFFPIPLSLSTTFSLVFSFCVYMCVCHFSASACPHVRF